MTLNVNRVKTANRDDRLIPVDYLIIHYTAVDLKDTLDIFINPESSVSSHLVIDTNGDIYELVDCLNGQAQRGWHAGVSEWQGVQGLNDCSVGIELVNYNGNVFPFTDGQYQSLQRVMARLQEHYPKLRDPERVIGHEHIAGFRARPTPDCCLTGPGFTGRTTPGWRHLCARRSARKHCRRVCCNCKRVSLNRQQKKASSGVRSAC